MSKAAFPCFSSSGQCWGLAGALCTNSTEMGKKNQLCNIISKFQTGIKEYNISRGDRACSGIKVGRIQLPDLDCGQDNGIHLFQQSQKCQNLDFPFQPQRWQITAPTLIEFSQLLAGWNSLPDKGEKLTPTSCSNDGRADPQLHWEAWWHPRAIPGWNAAPCSTQNILPLPRARLQAAKPRSDTNSAPSTALSSIWY